MLNKSASLSTQDHVLHYVVALDLVIKTQVDRVVKTHVDLVVKTQACAVWLFSTLLLSSKGKFHTDSSARLYTCLWIDLTPPIVLCPCWLDWLDFQQLAPSPWHLCSQDKFCLYIIEIRSLYRSLVLYSRVGTYLASYWSLTNSSAVLCLSLRVNRLRIRGIILTTIIVVGQPVQCRGQSLTSQAYAHFTDWKLLLKYIILFHQKLQLHDTKTLKM